MRRAVTGEWVLTSPMGQQYCPEPRIPLNCSTGLTGIIPEKTRAAAWCVSGLADSPRVFAWCVFMAVFLFTSVNTQYKPGRVLYPDFASYFAARFICPCGEVVFCWKTRYNNWLRTINNCELPEPRQILGRFQSQEGKRYVKDL